MDSVLLCVGRSIVKESVVSEAPFGTVNVEGVTDPVPPFTRSMVIALPELFVNALPLPSTSLSLAVSGLTLFFSLVDEHRTFPYCSGGVPQSTFGAGFDVMLDSTMPANDEVGVPVTVKFAHRRPVTVPGHVPEPMPFGAIVMFWAPGCQLSTSLSASKVYEKTFDVPCRIMGPGVAIPKIAGVMSTTCGTPQASSLLIVTETVTPVSSTPFVSWTDGGLGGPVSVIVHDPGGVVVEDPVGGVPTIVIRATSVCDELPEKGLVDIRVHVTLTWIWSEPGATTLGSHLPLLGRSVPFAW
jgi:hypothetical protein